MADRYKAKAEVTIIKDVEVIFEDDEHTVLEDQARDAVLEAAGVFMGDDYEVNDLTFRKVDIKKSSEGDVGLVVECCSEGVDDAK
ncbi:MAG: hypothetical protein AB1847_19750 [bacterium]